MDQLQRRISVWAESTFEHTEEGIAAHLLSEAAELYFSTGGSWKNAVEIVSHADDKGRHGGANVDDEMADVTILAMTLAGKRNVSLSKEVTKKMRINRNRSWGVRNKMGFTERSPITEIEKEAKI